MRMSDFVVREAIVPDLKAATKEGVIREMVELDVFLASLLISMALPLALFLVFQRLFLNSASLSAAVKG